MTLELSLTLPPALRWDRGVGEEAQRVREYALDAADYASSITLAASNSAPLDSLFEAFTSALHPDWDGLGAAPADPRALANAIQFLLSLPTTFPAPDVGVDPDGDMEFEWDCGPERVFTLTISPDGVINYAGMVGSSIFHGSELLYEGLPSALSAALARVVPASVP